MSFKVGKTFGKDSLRWLIFDFTKIYFRKKTKFVLLDQFFFDEVASKLLLRSKNLWKAFVCIFFK